MINSNDPIFVDSVLKVTAKTDINIEDDLNIPTNSKTKSIEELLHDNEETTKEK